MAEHDHRDEQGQHGHGHAGHDHGGHEHGHVMFDTAAMAAKTEREGEVLADFVTQAATRITEVGQQQGVEVRRVIDLGCGPGVGSCLLAEQFQTATVVAVDGSAEMLERVGARTERLLLGTRVQTQQAELSSAIATLGAADLVWASMSLHHIGDEVDALGQIRGLVDPGGLLAVVERAGPVRVLPDDVDLGRPGLWSRLHDAWEAWFAAMRAELPGATVSGAYGTMISAAGFDVLVDELLTVAVDPPLEAQAREFALQQLQGTCAQLAGYADAADLEVLEPLVDETSDQSILRRDDLCIRAARHLFVARPA
jgi:SAM-dependent methyltransferase